MKTPEKTLEESFRELRQKYSDYQIESYNLIYGAVDFTLKRLPRREKISSSEFLEGFRLYAIEQFGCLAKTILNKLEIRTTNDIGELLFRLIEFHIFHKDKNDDKKDYDNVFDFDKAFNLKPVVSYDYGRNNWEVRYVQRN